MRIFHGGQVRWLGVKVGHIARYRRTMWVLWKGKRTDRTWVRSLFGANRGFYRYSQRTFYFWLWINDPSPNDGWSPVRQWAPEPLEHVPRVTDFVFRAQYRKS